MILLSVCFFLTGIEDVIKPFVPFSGLLAVMACGVCVQRMHLVFGKVQQFAAVAIVGTGRGSSVRFGWGKC